ncbi:MAG TPA: DUF554 domain-containing protein [Candidatus Lachnoclostridium pullistercoris]|mgnify:FL=1|uniref:DUF554 domain-containing protein n=1 Tax=Candidatus Lachnoclostridium pullistercoris TaxID=2838632 RepID=A0A9D2PBW3_9FIRM|nr:DUF554 domain-containing protein [Candidatus Lachnoclostridium pullistercoris]
MPIGLLCNCGAVFVGGLAGTVCGKYLTERMKEVLTIVFGLSAVANGIVSIIKVGAMPPVIMAVIVGTFFGELLQLERRVRGGLHGALERLPISTERIDMDEYVTIVAIFCASGFGIYGVLMEGMSGESSILLSKSVMDLFTALIFAGAMGAAVSLAAVPQLIVFLIIFGLSKLVVPLTTPELLSDFMACGGILTVAAGLRVSKIKDSPIINMLPALIFVMPFSSLWGMVF